MDDASEISPLSPVQNQHHSNGTASPRENGMMVKKMDHQDRDRIGPHSPRSGTSSNASTPSNKKIEDKPSTPIAKSVTPTNSNPSNGIGGGGGGVGVGGGGGGGSNSGASGSNSSGAGAGGNSNQGGLVKAVANKPPVLNPNYPHYLAPMNGAAPHDIQAAAYAAGVHNNLPPALNNYPRAPLQVGFDPHAQMRAPLGPALGAIPGGKP